MITQLTSNKIGWFGGALSLIASLAILGFFTYTLMYSTHQYQSFTPNKYLNWGLIAVAIFNIGYVTQKFYPLPIGAIIDDELNTINVKYLIKKQAFIRLDEIDHYSYTTIKSGRTTFTGLDLYLSDGTKILFSDLNFADYSPVEAFLRDNKVERTMY